MTTSSATRRYDHAVVLGGSMAGLATAQALSRHFHRVTIIERDRLPTEPTGRPGVPQAQHLHALLPGGANALEALLPGFADGLLAAGAVPLAAPTDFVWLNPQGYVTRFPARDRILSASRDVIEWHTRQMVRTNPCVSILDGRNVLDLSFSADRVDVTGVMIVEVGSSEEPDGGSVVTLPADLVVDATGRRSRLPDWLERAGYERAKETRIDAHLTYASRIYRRPSRDLGWKAAFIQSQPPTTSRAGIAFPIEGERMMVTVQGAGDERPPTDDRGFEAFAASLRSTAIHDAIAAAEPLTSVANFANTSNRRRHYDRLRRWPERLVAVGDGVCAFNPVYGQGMSVAAQTAVLLDDQLTRHSGRHPTLDGFARTMQHQVAKAGDAAWLIATGDDVRLPATTGGAESVVTRLQHRYLDRVLGAATTDEVVLGATMDAFFLLAPPTVLFRPKIAVRSLLRRPMPATPSRPVPSQDYSVVS